VFGDLLLNSPEFIGQWLYDTTEQHGGCRITKIGAMRLDGGVCDFRCGVHCFEIGVDGL
jgi:hypothetical protein